MKNWEPNISNFSILMYKLMDKTNYHSLKRWATKHGSCMRNFMPEITWFLKKHKNKKQNHEIKCM